MYKFSISTSDGSITRSGTAVDTPALRAAVKTVLETLGFQPQVGDIMDLLNGSEQVFAKTKNFSVKIETVQQTPQEQ